MTFFDHTLARSLFNRGSAEGTRRADAPQTRTELCYRGVRGEPVREHSPLAQAELRYRGARYAPMSERDAARMVFAHGVGGVYRGTPVDYTVLANVPPAPAKPLTYRGTAHAPAAPAETSNEGTLVYRGVRYAKADLARAAEATAELRYRGVAYCTTPAEHAEEVPQARDVVSLSQRPDAGGSHARSPHEMYSDAA